MEIHPVLYEGEDNHSNSGFLFDSSRNNLFKNESLLERFRHNQIELKNRFKQYVSIQKVRYPLTNKHLRTEAYSDSEEE